MLGFDAINFSPATKIIDRTQTPCTFAECSVCPHRQKCPKYVLLLEEMLVAKAKKVEPLSQPDEVIVGVLNALIRKTEELEAKLQTGSEQNSEQKVVSESYNSSPKTKETIPQNGEGFLDGDDVVTLAPYTGENTTAWVEKKSIFGRPTGKFVEKKVK